MKQPTFSWGTLLVLACAVLWGTVGVTTRGIYSLSDTDPLSIGFYRLLISVPVLAALAMGSLGRKALQPRAGVAPRWGRDLGYMAGFGAMMALYQVCYFAAIPRLGVTIAVIVTICSAPIMVAVLSALLFNEKITPRVVTALIAAVLGTSLLALQGPVEAQVGGETVIGLLFALGSGFGYAVLTLISRALAERYHPLQPITVAFAVGALLLFPLAFAGGLTIDYPTEAWGLLIYLGVVPTALAYWIFLLALRTVPATVASILTLLEPLTSATLAALIFNESLSALGWAGAVLLLGALLVLLVKR